MTTITTRATKGSTLTYNELDANFSRNAQAKVANYTVVEGDNNDTIECSGTFTVTLPDAATIAAASDTGDFEVTIYNSGTGTITIGRTTGADTVNGVAANITVLPSETLTLKVNQAGNGYNINSGRILIASTIAGTGSSGTLQITSGLGGAEYLVSMKLMQDQASNICNISINGDTTAGNYIVRSSYSGGVDTVPASRAIWNPGASANAYLEITGNISITPNGTVMLTGTGIQYDGTTSYSISVTARLTTTTSTSLTSLSFVLTGGSFTTSSFIKLSRLR